MYLPFYHSNYGLGGSDFKKLFETIKEYGIPACGIVDRTLFGLNEFLNYAKEYGVKPIIGTRIFLKEFHSPFFLFVKERNGYENLCAILTHNAFNRLNSQILKEQSRGLVFVSNSEELIEEFSAAFSNIYFLLYPKSFILPKKRVPIVCANEVFYVQPEDRILYRLLAIIKKFKTEDVLKRPCHLIKPERLKKIFYYQEGIENIKEFSDLCNYIPKPDEWIFPKIEKGLLEILKPKLNSLNNYEKKRVMDEYRVIKEMGFEPYFVLIYELKEFAKEKGMGVNVRGSAASSFILYLLGLSVVNPLRYKLPFERFLNQKRREPPDIDLDVKFNQRERLIQEIFKKFGKARVAHLSMINRFHTRARFRETARVFGVPPLELKRIKDHSGEKLIQKIDEISSRIDNYPHYFSCHPSGIVITPDVVYRYVPLYPSPKGPITHFDKDAILLAGLVKIDILGVRGFPELYLKRDEIDFNDQRVYKFIHNGKTLGCFQIESPAVRQVLKRIKPKTLMDIANGIAIIRPGPSQGGMKEKFLKRLNGREKTDYLHPALEGILKETHGVFVYQEQILATAHRFGFSLEDADYLRRAITKGRNTPLIKEIKERFFIQAEEMGYGKREIMDVWKRIEAFSSFSFNKAHSITYATLAYLSAYQKFYDPLRFFCRLINNQGGYYPTTAYINEARRWGIRILPPDVNKSDIGFSLRGNSLITGLVQIKNLSMNTIQQIIRFRPYNTIQEFFFKVKLEIDEGSALIKSGALDCFKRPQSELYFFLLKSKTRQNLLQERLKISEEMPRFNDFSERLKLGEKLKVLGFLPEMHTIQFFFPERERKILNVSDSEGFRLVKIDNPQEGHNFVILKDSYGIMLIGLLIAHRTVLTKTKKLVSFLTLDDETGIIDVHLISIPGGNYSFLKYGC